MKERMSSQLRFGIEDNKFFVPESILDKDYGEQIVPFLEKRKIWQHRPKGDAVLIYYDGDNIEISYFNPSNWQVLEVDKRPKKLAAAVVVCTSLDLEVVPVEDMEKGSAFYVFERTDGKVSKEDREGKLVDLGLVERNVLNSSLSGFCVWEARFEKPRKPRSPINLLDKEKRPRSHNWARYLWRQMVSEYRRFGFEVVADPKAPIVERLRNSKNPPDDFSRLKMGWGVEIKNPSCGCHAKVSLDGDVDWIYQCGEESHHNLK